MKKLTKNLSIMLILAFLLSTFPCTERTVSAATTKLSAKSITMKVGEVKTFIPKSNRQKKKAISEKQYKKKCKRMYHDKLFFSKKDLEGKYVKVKLFLSDSRRYEYPNDFTQKYKTGAYFYYAKPERKGETSYVSGGDISVYFGEKYCKKDYWDFKTGDYVMIYGKIVSYNTTTWTGYNDCSILVKYIEKTSH